MGEERVQRPSGGDPVQRNIYAGAVWGLVAALIAAGWLVFTRMGHARILNGYDLVALRYGIAGLILLPYAYRYRSLLVGHGWPALTFLILGGGFPYGLAAVWGLGFAPVAHGGALIAGTIPTFTAMFGVAILAQRLQTRQILGLVLTVVAAAAIGGPGLFSEFGSQTIGHALFLVGAMLWALYTVMLRKFGMPPLQATAIVCVGSALLYVPLYPFVLETKILAAPWPEILFQAVYQGVLAGVVFFIAFNRAVELLGSARAAVFLALVPVLAVLMAGPILGEIPNAWEIFGIVAAASGVYLVTGARLKSA